jgi:CBS domain-containing protein
MQMAAQLLKHKGGDIYSVDPDAPVLDAIKLMAEHSVGALLVMKDQQLIGVVSERDYARKVILRGLASSNTPVRQIMSAPVVTIDPQKSVRDCMQVMTDRHIRHLPVAEGERVLGVLSIGDLVRAVLEDQQQQIEELERYIRS